MIVAEENISIITDDMIQSIRERLQKNRDLALKQQEEQKPKNFRLDNFEFINVHVSELGIFLDSPFFGEIGYSDQLTNAGALSIGKAEFELELKNTMIEETSPVAKVGMKDAQGMRESMEDASLFDRGSFKINNVEYPFTILGVFDGHGGAEGSVFVKNEILRELERKFTQYNSTTISEYGLFHAFKQSFIEIDKRYKTPDGTTATIAVIFHGSHFPLKEQIWIANVGDSRIVLIDKDYNARQATEDAKPEMARYKKTINKLGGYVSGRVVSRVNGRLAVARAIGDHSIKGWTGECCVSPKPKITSYSLEDFKKGYIVLACDGLYDVASTNEIGKAIRQLSFQKASIAKMSEELVKGALYSGTSDNVSVVVAHFN